ncbi:hypothetical protein PSU4_39220 [Pseudonocardia sulfidoxydans NBRC 16205]|uniref:SCO6045-like C-terminal domain-containing protein n=1 Tax=Pseudonocardia sulfidoxydans NBRC 16205 TaxID=1223511 RepID=A0A511DPI8_9PSEU|nr:hypothetical protein [Pseudonocardia sulfidoxydans]GEL24968.1 hypothetical protein PSU4_39220 [Pseudonocardia sulfidoxydans NBRC 16205]
MTGSLAAAQAALVDSLVAGAAVPAGFDDVRLATVRRALLRKRSGEIARTWPLLAAAHGQHWAGVVATHLDGVAPGGSLRDGFDVARALRAAGQLPPSAAEELASREAGWRYDGTSAPTRRRVPTVRRGGGALFVQVGGRTLRLG